MPAKHLLFLSLLVAAVSCAASTSTPTSVAPPGERLELVKGLAIAEIAVFQGPKVTLAKDGVRNDTRRAPVIAARPGILRVYVQPADDWAEREVVATLTLKRGDDDATKKVATVKQTISAVSSDDVIGSTINFDLGLDEIASDTSFSVALKTEPGQTSAGSSDAAQYPADGALESLAAKNTGEKLHVKIVPIRYDADGSGRLPDISPGQLEVYRKGFQRLYPAREVEISVRAAYPWASAIERNGTGFESLLRAIISLRQRDGAPKGIYYYGAFAAAPSFSTWCGFGCVAGLSPVAETASDTWGAASIGVGWSGENTVGTSVHEVGHGHGRTHAPCAMGGSIQGVDPRFPHSGANLGVWAYDVDNKALIAPTGAKDFMGYCDPKFVSDYTFGALATRMAETYTTAAFEIGGAAQTFRLISVRGDGTLEDGEEVVTSDSPMGEERTVTVTLTDGATAPVRAAYYPWDHLPGGLLVVPVGAPMRALEARGLIPGAVSKLTFTK